MKLRIPLSITVLLATSLLQSGETIFSDAFAKDDKVPERRAMRGDWQIADGVASVTQDDALYKKFKDHGPIIFYDFPTTNATFHYAVKPEGCKSVVFTLNGEEGHIFRFVSGAAGTNVRAFPPEGDAKSIATAREKEWVLPDSEWTDVKVVIVGSSATITVGGFEPLIVEHASYDRAKSNFSVGFAFGSLAIKDVRVTTD